MKTELTERKIQRVLSGFFASNSVKYDIDGLYVFDWESDKLLETRSGYIYEFEIKISRADYKNDFKHKGEKHAILKGEKYTPTFWKYFESPNNKALYPTVEKWEEYCRKWRKSYFCENHKRPNYFYYAVPYNMIQADEVPEYAGLIYITETGQYAIVKKAPCLHKEKYTDGDLNLGEKFYYNMLTWKRNSTDWQKQYEYQREHLQKELESKGHEKTYEQLEKELKAEKYEAEFWKREYKVKHGLYMTMVEGADYNTIERHVFFDVLKELGVDVNEKYSEIMKEAEKRYKERYPNRK